MSGTVNNAYTILGIMIEAEPTLLQETGNDHFLNEWIQRHSQLDIDDINEAVHLLERMGAINVSKTVGQEPFDFINVEIKSRGKLLYYEFKKNLKERTKPLNPRAQNAIEMLRKQVEDLESILWRADEDNDWETALARVNRWRDRTTKLISEQVHLDEAEKLSNLSTPQSVVKQVDKFRSFLSALIEALEDHPEVDLGIPQPDAPQGVEMAIEALPARAKDTRKVFVVHGRNEKARKALFDFLRSIDLHPQEWSEWVHETGHGSPYVGNVLKEGFKVAQAFVVLMTPDDEARLRIPLQGDNEPPYETDLTPQPRPNVIFEAGMALAIDEQHTILVELGSIRPISDIHGRHVVKLNNTAPKRKDLAQRLKGSGCPVNTKGNDWLEAGDFDGALEGFNEIPNEAVSISLSKEDLLWRGVKEGDKQLLLAIYRYMISHNTLAILFQAFRESEEGKVFPADKLEEDIRYLQFQLYLLDTNGMDAPVKVIELYGLGFELCARHLERDFEEIETRAIKIIAEIGGFKDFAEMVKQVAPKIGRSELWTGKLLGLFVGQGWINPYAGEVGKKCRVTPLGRRVAESRP